MADQQDHRRGGPLDREQRAVPHPLGATAAGVLVTAALSLTGCAHTGHGLATYDASGESDGADSGPVGAGTDQLDGTLVVTEDCVRVEAVDGEQVLPVFPATGVDFDHGSLVLTFGGTGYRDGDPVTLPGAVVTDQTGIVVPSGCDAPTMWWVSAD